MIFSSALFLFGFLPIALIIYYLSPTHLKNTTLLLCSLFFYAWGEFLYILVLLMSILINYSVGLLIQKYSFNSKYKKISLIIGVILNLLILISFKYSHFIVENINILLKFISLPQKESKPIHLPLGISFFTFQTISYIVDVYRGKVNAQKGFINFALYISFFPQLIAGPIVRYIDIKEKLINRVHSYKLFSMGVEKFTFGLSKKVLIANPLGEVVDSTFLLTGSDLTMPLAWIGIIFYSLQLYFDFSGYSDMAIGLGRMFGFKIIENFNYPYISKSIREFWSRWHISLSFWFRDYVFKSLRTNKRGGNRIINIMIVFTLTGLWHGDSWKFLFGGVWFGVFVALEHAGLARLLKKQILLVQYLYTFLVIVIAWLFFRIENLSSMATYLYSMFDVSNIRTTLYQFAEILSIEASYACLVGVVISMPSYPFIKNQIRKIKNPKLYIAVEFFEIILVTLLLLLCSIKIASSTYSPFIYFRF